MPGKAAETFRVQLGGVGSYRIVADAKAGDLFAKDSVTTSVSGMADIDLDVVEKKRVLDVGESTIFDIKLKNIGTKDAKKLQVTAFLKNVDVTDTAGLDEHGPQATFDDKGTLLFPEIESLAPGRRAGPGASAVKATKPEAPRAVAPRSSIRISTPTRASRRSPPQRVHAQHAGRARHAAEVSPDQSARPATASISPRTASR